MFFFFKAEDGIRDLTVTGVQTCALPILHDEVSTDRRNPTLNANGSIYGSLELSADYLPVLDPVRNTTSCVPLTVRDPTTEQIGRASCRERCRSRWSPYH